MNHPLPDFAVYAAPASTLPAHLLAELDYIKNERIASHETPVLINFVKNGLIQHNYKMAHACFLFLINKKCDINGVKGKMLMRGDGVTPSIIHELSQALYTISMTELAVRLGFKIPDIELLLCINFMHDLGEDFDVTRQDLLDHFEACGLTISAREEKMADLFESMTKSRKHPYKSLRTADYFNILLDDILTVLGKYEDRIHNMATMIKVKKPDKYRDYILEARELRASLLQAQVRYPEYKTILDRMDGILVAQIAFNARHYNKIYPKNQIPMTGDDIRTTWHAIQGMPHGLDPMRILWARAKEELAWIAAYKKPDAATGPLLLA